MTPEQRLDRLERIAKLFVRAGLRERSFRRELEAKLNIIVDYQIANEERFAKNEERFATLTDTVNRLAQAQTGTEQRLDSLIKAIDRDRNGHGH